MKNYNEMATDVFRRIDEYKVEQNRKKRVAALTITSLCFMCLIAVIGFGTWNSGLFDLDAQITNSSDVENKDFTSQSETVNQQASNNATSSSNINADTTQSQNIPQQSENNNTLPNLSLPSLSQWQQDANVVWGSGSALKGNNSTGISVDLGKILITPELKSSFTLGKKNTIYAVMVDFTPMAKNDILIEGKAIAEWNNEVKALAAQGKNTEAKAIAQKIREAEEKTYFEQIEELKPRFASMGLGVYHENYGCTIYNCIFYTFATQEQIEQFKCNSDEAFIFTNAVRFK